MEGARERLGERSWRELERSWGGGVVREECRHKTLMRKAYNAHLKLSPGERRGDLEEEAMTFKDEG